jgi:RNA recognition motif-containing protein
MNESKLLSFFKKYSPINAKILKSQKEGFGYGFVNFPDHEKAKAAKDNNPKIKINDIEIKVSYSQKHSDSISNQINFG